MATRKPATPPPPAARPRSPPKRARQATQEHVGEAEGEEATQGYSNKDLGALDDHDIAAFRSGLRPGPFSGVYINRMGVTVDWRGIALSFLALKKADAVRSEEAIGEAADTPAKYLKSVALDPRMPLGVRLDSAKAAAPYFDQKKPLAVEGGDPAKPIGVSVNFPDLKGLGTDELKTLIALMKKAGAPV